MMNTDVLSEHQQELTFTRLCGTNMYTEAMTKTSTGMETHKDILLHIPL